jgi:hypothetical protein
MTDRQKFTDKEIQLRKALKRVTDQLQQYKDTAELEFHSKYETLTEAQRQSFLKRMDLWNWNAWHDLEDRLKARLWANWSAFHDWHFSAYGWNGYNY